MVAEALRQSIGEKPVTLDASAPRETYRHVANFGVIAEDEHDESEVEEFGGDDTAFEVHDNWWDEDQLEEIDEDTLDNLMSDYANFVSEDVEDLDEELAAAIDVFALQKRSFAEGRDMVSRLRVSRGYCPISRSPAFEPGRSKSKGRGEVQNQDVERKGQDKGTRYRLSVKATARTVGAKTPAGDRGPQRTGRDRWRQSSWRTFAEETRRSDGHWWDDLATMDPWRFRRTTTRSTTSKVMSFVWRPTPNGRLLRTSR